MTRHDWHQRTRTNMIRDQRLWQKGDPYSIYSRRYERHCIISYETSLRSHRYDLIAIHELPLLRVPHYDLMLHNLVRCLGRTVSFDIGRTCNQFAKDRSDTSCNKVRVRQIPQPDSTIKTFPHEIRETIRIGGNNL